MGYNFSYSDPDYIKKQSEITKLAWLQGKYDFKKSVLTKKHCSNPKCNKYLFLKPHELQTRKFCSSRCSALVNSPKRITSEITKQKISKALKGIRPKIVNRILLRTEILCKNPACRKVVSLPPYLAKRQKYCSNKCAISIVGKMTTSPKASKGKPGIRTDISPDICFYSTWEANVARVFNLVGVRWEYAPKIFDLGEHTYRPDFYLPDFDTYIEVKNFMGEYSLNRDKQFRRLYPNIKLDLIMKEEYNEIKSNYKFFIKNWEY